MSTCVIIFDVETMCPVVVAVDKETDWVGALYRALLVATLIFFVASATVALLLLQCWWAHGQKLVKLLLGLLLLVGEQGNLLLKALYAGCHLLDRLHRRD